MWRFFSGLAEDGRDGGINLGKFSVGWDSGSRGCTDLNGLHVLV